MENGLLRVEVHRHPHSEAGPLPLLIDTDNFSSTCHLANLIEKRSNWEEWVMDLGKRKDEFEIFGS